MCFMGRGYMARFNDVVDDEDEASCEDGDDDSESESDATCDPQVE